MKKKNTARSKRDGGTPKDESHETIPLKKANIGRVIQREGQKLGAQNLEGMPTCIFTPVRRTVSVSITAACKQRGPIYNSGFPKAEIVLYEED